MSANDLFAVLEIPPVVPPAEKAVRVQISKTLRNGKNEEVGLVLSLL